MHEGDTELLQFPYSHFNEKARWALDFKGVRHTKTNVLPGPHAIRMMRLTGQNEVPVVRFGDKAVHDSARIIDELESRYSEPALYPADPERRCEALEIQKHFDDEVGPSVRRALFSLMIPCPDYMVRVFGEGHGRAKLWAYRKSFALVSRVIARSTGADSESRVEKAFVETEAALTFVAERAGPEGHLVGDSFSVADLAAAALLAPVANPRYPTMHRPEPQPASILEWNERWKGHPGVDWVLDRYARYRAPAGPRP
jgi:glutathione S-transferase